MQRSWFAAGREKPGCISVVLILAGFLLPLRQGPLLNSNTLVHSVGWVTWHSLKKVSHTLRHLSTVCPVFVLIQLSSSITPEDPACFADHPVLMGRVREAVKNTDVPKCLQCVMKNIHRIIVLLIQISVVKNPCWCLLPSSGERA